MRSTTRAPGRPPDPEREEAILDAALEVLAEVGYDRLTVSAVHKRAHASAKTVYRRWSGKEELMTAALQHAVTRAGHTPDEVPDTGTLRGDLVATLHRPSAAPTRNLAHGLLAVAATSGELGALALELLRSQEARLMKVILARARERGETGDGLDPMLVADVTRGMTLQHLLLTDEPADAEFVETLVDRVLLPVIRAESAQDTPGG
ncbi:TetR/AcrR family transcriptional regulator [Pseudonocardia abyssalis]|jgi:AcrR family transcriptional regulator|uniref:TetR/AcrR family transcriptional regulator n=1 Tax=Pseudonocardia abyssalis TaxID=2792008 RepID=A0ABS6UV41_9PSEU|nr:TetR/AcrR family transcriptional regulator [Pseudonocardia abyssalis]MBW0117782.1 TetR/AcrR family transcriptional regulator [Pseudonocardia abyssalis]MBW0136135.1 TetR/AcrR family transcriptional regulator [Pseudonocardia abyssalis]